MRSANRRPPVPFLFVLVTIGALTGLCPPAAAEPVEIQGGTVVLAATGLEIDLPAATSGRAYRIAASFALSADGFDGRDVIDEVAGEDLVAGTWVQIGYFDAGDPAAVVAAVELADDWTAQVDIWGATWRVRGGIFTFEGDLGARPALVACIQAGDGKALILHRFFLTEPLDISQPAMLAAFEAAAVARAAWTSYDRNRTGAVRPTTRPEMRNRGDLQPTRRAYLENALIELELPDDGFVWLVRSDPDQAVDFLERMAPALPEVTIEVVVLYDVDCDAVFESLTLEKRAVQPQNLPVGWTAGPQLVVDGDLELTACRETVEGVALVGIFQGPTDTDVGYLAPMLAAIARAVDEP
ncbi:MAG TPA: hypothetical protein PLL30_00505 [Candidatus Krumholzibacteria bacterium]|nr:hypothetical protein [Candidatus Krumholzibacteria bacterium]HPD70240.1 hypothetical protein [Candidatus Krumholzibacteria bacterium]HRY40060.1 hypothetical protein [Candidatus Krumholzibacteria bacterium]